MGMEQAWLMPAIPAAAFVVLLFVGNYLPRKGDWVAVLAIGAAFVLFFPVFADLLDALDGGEFAGAEKSWEWFSFGDFEIRLGFFVDQITVVMLCVVSAVALMVQIYSIGYMNGDPRYGWYFTVMCLFTASMLTLVLADNLLLMYAAWEVVGFCSFLLIGFWWEKQSAAEAAKKAFITTRIGDVGFLIGIILLWLKAGTFDISEIIAFAEGGGYDNDVPHRRDPLRLRRRGRQVRPVPAARLAPGRHGGPDARLRPDPRGHDGRRRRLPRGPHAARLRGGGPDSRSTWSPRSPSSLSSSRR